jgi:transcriptional regulator with PAS, ATPase and Fis domain
VIPLKGIERSAPAAALPALESPAQMIALEDLERRHIEAVLRVNNFNKSRTAEILNISRRTLDRRIADFRLLVREG